MLVPPSFKISVLSATGQYLSIGTSAAMLDLLLLLIIYITSLIQCSSPQLFDLVECPVLQLLSVRSQHLDLPFYKV